MIVNEDIELLRQGNMKPTRGDIRCIIFGHLIRLAIWTLRIGWNREIATKARLKKVDDWISNFGGPQSVEMYLDDTLSTAPEKQAMMIRESEAIYERPSHEIPF